jgi:glycyl-tRNA synthetase (class II)
LKDTVTLRHRDTGAQERVPLDALATRIRAAIA